jgi:hypothetical protein
MGNLLNMAIKMQDPTTTTTTTTAATKTVQWTYDPTGCSGMTAQVLKNASSIFSGGSASSGSFTVVPGDTITVSNTIGPKPSIGCNQANALIGSTPGGTEYGSQTVTGANNTATVTYTVVSGTASTIYVTAGLAIA